MPIDINAKFRGWMEEVVDWEKHHSSFIRMRGWPRWRAIHYLMIADALQTFPGSYGYLSTRHGHRSGMEQAEYFLSLQLQSGVDVFGWLGADLSSISEEYGARYFDECWPEGKALLKEAKNDRPADGQGDQTQES